MINNLKSPKTNSKSKRVGRGYGSGVGGHTTGRGTKGQKSRSGYSIPRPGFEGGQMPLSRRIPKLKGSASNSSRGRSYFISRKNEYVVNLSDLLKINESEIDSDAIIKSGIVKVTGDNPEFKILYDKDIDAKLIVKGIKASKKAADSITKAGGKIE